MSNSQIIKPSAKGGHLSNFLSACVTAQLVEEVLFQISYLADLTASHMIQFRGVQYDIVRMDTFEGYKADLKLYCKRKK